MVDVMRRRDRLREQTTREINTVALRLMADGGPGAITLRAIAREMGMTAGAIYGYYDTRDDLVTELISQVYASLVDTLEAARDAIPEHDPAGRLLAWAQALREWAIANPDGFRLIYGDAVPGYVPPPDGPAAEAERRACTGLVGLAAAAWPHAAALQSIGVNRWSDFDDALVEHIQADFPELPPAALALALRLWGRMHGLVALEVYGHLTPQSRQPAQLYRAEILDLVRSLGMESK